MFRYRKCDTICVCSGWTTPNTPLPNPPDLLPRQLTTREAQLVDHLVRLQLVSTVTGGLRSLISGYQG